MINNEENEKVQEDIEKIQEEAESKSSELEFEQDDKGIKLIGEVVEILPNTQFKVKLQNGVVVLAYTSGKMRKNKIRIILFDKVSVRISHSDVENLKNSNNVVKARLEYRYKK